MRTKLLLTVFAALAAAPAGAAPPDLYGVRRGASRLFDHDARSVTEDLSGGSQFHPAFGAFEKLHAHFLFQLAYLVAQRGLRDVEQRGGTGEMKFLGHCEEVSEVADLHRWIMSQREASTNKD